MSRKDSVMSRKASIQGGYQVEDLSLAGRSYENPFSGKGDDDSNAATVDPDHTTRLARMSQVIESYTTKLMDSTEAKKEERFRQDGSIYVGGSGVAYICLMSASACAQEWQRMGWLNLAQQFAEIDVEEEAQPGRHNASLMCGMAGRVLVDLMVRYARDEDVDVSRYLAFEEAAVTSKCDEILYGRAGYLWGLLQLKRMGLDVPDKIIMKVANLIIEKGREGGANFDGAPWMWQWHDKKYLGAAHGVMGVLYVLMLVPGFVQAHRSDIKLMINWLAARREDDYEYNWPASVRFKVQTKFRQ